MGPFPTPMPDGGLESPPRNKVDSSQDFYLMFNATQAAQGAAVYCAQLISDRVVLSSSTPPPSSGKIQTGAEKGGIIAFTVLWDIDSCDLGTSSADQKLDFNALGQDQCYQNLYVTLAQECNLFLHLVSSEYC